MIKTTYFCDKCAGEMKEPLPSGSIICQNDRLFGVEIKPFAADVDRWKDKNLHICKYCIVDLIVNGLDDRPKAG